MAGNVELRINGVDATKAAFSSAEQRATTLNRRFGELSRRQQAALRREAREVRASERAYAQYQKEQEKAAATARRTSAIRVAVVAAAAAKIGGWLKETTELYAEQERAVASMEQALRSQGSYTPQLSAYYQAMASDLQHLGTIGDETTLEMQALLTQIGDVGPEDMRRALEAAQDLSVGIGRDLKVAVELVGKAAAGETGTLKRYGIVLDEAALEGDKLEAVLGAIEDRFGGQMGAYAETHAGRMERAANAWGDVKENIGALLAGPLASLMEGLAGVATDISDAASGSRSWMDTLAEWAGMSGAVAHYRGEVEQTVDTTAELERLQQDAIAAAEEAPEKIPPAWEAAGFESEQRWRAHLQQMEEDAEAAAKALTERFWAEAEIVTDARARDSALGLKSAAVLAAIQEAGAEAGSVWSLAYASGVDGMVTTELPEVVGGISELPSWEESGFQSAGMWADPFLKQLDGLLSSGIRNLFDNLFGGSWWGQLAGGVAGRFAENFMGGLGDKLSTATGLWGRIGGLLGGGGGAGGAAGGAGGGIAGIGAGATAALGAVPIWGWAALGGLAAFAFFRGFGGPSEAEVAARDSWHSFSDFVRSEIGETDAYTQEVNRAMADGWDRSNAEARASFILLGQQAGMTYDESFRLFEEYTQALHDGDQARMDEIEEMLGAQLDDWKAMNEERVANAEESDAAVVGSAESSSAGVTAAWAAVPDKTITVTTIQRTIHETIEREARGGGRRGGGVPGGGITPGRALGGPVAAGQAYLVGERGPEMFVPAQSGAILPHGLTAEAIGAAVAAALQRAPVVATVGLDAVTDATLLHGPRRQALRGYA